MKYIVLTFSLLVSFNLFGQIVPEITLQTAGDGMFLVEGCSEVPDSIVITLDEPQSRDVVFTIGTSGSADAADYTFERPETLTFEAGSFEIKLPIAALADMETEDRETLTITLFDNLNQEVASVSILILDELEVNIAQDNIEVCQGETVELNTVIPGDYIWLVDEDTMRGDRISFVADAEFQVRVLTSYGLCSAEDEIDIMLRAGIVFNAGDTSYICLGETANITVDIIGNPAGDYQWSPMDSTLTVLDDQAIQVMTDQTRTYYLSFTNSDCAVMDSIVVRVDSIPELPLTVVPEKETYCPGEIVTIFPRYLFPGDFPDIEYMWTFDAGTDIRGDTLKSFVLSTEDTSYFRLMTTNNACMRTDSVLLYVINPPVNLSLTDTTVCPDQPVSVELLNADDFDEIMWSPEEGISCTDCPNPTIRTPETRTYTVTAESMGCPASGSVQIQIFPPDLINIIPDTIVCPGEPIRLVAEEAAAYEQLTWMGNGLQCMDCESPVAIIDRPTNFQVTGVKPDGCLGVGGTNINTFALPSVSVGSEPLGPVEVGTSVVFTATTNPDITTSGTFTWFVNGNQIATMNAAIEASVPSEGENEIKVEVITPEGCMVMGNLNIEGTPPRFDIPSAFSPTGDELNDRFKVLIFGNIRLAEFKVFNRWGQLVYDGLNEEGWDGRHNGKEAPADVYAYSAILELPDGSLRSVRGEVTLIR